MTRLVPNMDGFFPVRLGMLASGRELPFSLHLYFPSNQHRILWKNRGDSLSVEDVVRRRRSGLSQAWVRDDDRKAVDEFVTTFPFQTEEARRLALLFLDPTLVPSLAAEARSLALRLLHSPDPATLDRSRAHAARVLAELLAAIHTPEARLASRLLRFSQEFPEIEHPLSVCTLSSLLHLALLPAESESFPETALAALLHDLGVPSIEHPLDDPAHVEAAPELIRDQLADTLDRDGIERVTALVARHHQRFDGKGYPGQADDPGFSRQAQLLALVELIETHSSEQVGFQKRTLFESIEALDSPSGRPSLQGSVSPDLLIPLLEWVRQQRPAIESRPQNGA